ncbi:hypothetical protein [Roseibium sp.]|uniref:hypothetical protein n=1 Tax=Roseibium sp. TaxID=1936156 RepID=UPI003A9864E5
MTGTPTSIDMSRKAERLVVEGVRRLMAGYATGDVGCWEMAWKLYAVELGVDHARKPSSELAHYARALKTHGKRALCLFPYDCPRLCQDECLVASLVAAAQAGDAAVLEAAGAALVFDEGVGETLYAAGEFAGALKDCGLMLKPVDLSSLPLEECPLKRLKPVRMH